MSRLPFTLTNLMTPSEPKGDSPKEVMTVHQLVMCVKKDIEAHYRQVHVIGEVSSFKPWRSGHWYFDIKDELAVLPCVMFKNLTSRVPFEVKDGLQIVVSGKATVYPQQSKIQIVVDKIEPCGVGALALAFEQLKEKLSLEGLFSSDRKKNLVAFPRVVGLVTSPQGAALSDMVRILRQRMPMTQVLLSPCRVQGQGSALEIAQALKRLDDYGTCDVIIVGRGGGSLEDLWSFNDENLARVIATCKTPIVSAVGHETDFSISDFVADIRAATPTHAASMVVPECGEVLRHVHNQQARLEGLIAGTVKNAHLTLERLARKIPEPRMLLMRALQRNDELANRLNEAMKKRISLHFNAKQSLKRRIELASPMARINAISRRLQNLSQRFWILHPKTKITTVKQRVANMEMRLSGLVLQSARSHKESLSRMAASLLALSPLAVMARGYAIVYKEHERTRSVVTKVDGVLQNDMLHVEFTDGAIVAQVVKKITKD